MNPITFVVRSSRLGSARGLDHPHAANQQTPLLCGSGHPGEFPPEIERLRPSAAVITLGAEPEAGLKFVGRLAAECPHTAIICASRDASPDLILRSIRAGAREFLRLPVIGEEFNTVLGRVAEFCAGRAEAPKKRGRVVAVFSSKGGCGTTFVATNLAAATEANTVLVDLNLQAGDLALFLGTEPKHSIADLVEKRAQADDALLKSVVVPYSEKLSLLAAPREADLADDIEPEHIFEVIELLREHYEYVYIDPQHTFDSITLSALDQADEIVLVLTLDIPAVRSAQRTLAIFDRLGYPRHKVKIVVNRWSKQIELDVKQVERHLGEKVMGFVQSDYHTAVNSINLGQPLVQSEPSSRIGQELRQIAAKITGAAGGPSVAEQRRGIWNSVFGRHVGNISNAGLRNRLDKGKAPATV